MLANGRYKVSRACWFLALFPAVPSPPVIAGRREHGASGCVFTLCAVV